MAGVPDLTAPLAQHVGNSVSGYLIALPVDQPDPSVQLARIRAQTSAYRLARAPLVNGVLARVGLKLLPRVLLPRIVRLFAGLVSACGVSSLRGPWHDQLGPWWNEHGASAGRVESFYFFGSFAPPRMPIMIGCCSIADRMRVTLALKTLRVGGSAEQVLGHIPHALRELKHSAAANNS